LRGAGVAREPRSGIGGANRRERELADGSAAVGRSIERRVMDDHDLAIGREVHIHLERVRT
jgi:hypothetical protein